MAELMQSPAVLMPGAMTVGTTCLAVWDTGPVTAVMPYRGRSSGLAAAMQAAHGLGWPDANRVSQAGATLCVWSGLDQAMLVGVVPDPALVGHAALVDQSDSWAAVTLDGAEAADVLARLVPVDLRAQAFPVGYAARTQLGHMPVILCRPADAVLRIMVFRSMAETLLHELKEAMSGVAARGKG